MCEKLAQVHLHVCAIQGFLEWLGAEKGIRLASYSGRSGDELLYPVALR